MARGLKGDLSTLRGLKARIKAFPVSLRHDVAQQAAPAMTALTQQAYTSDTTVYGQARPTSEVDGSTLTLDKSGKTKAGLRFVATGTLIRCALPERYTRYLIGKYSILPNGALPAKWSAKLAEIVSAQKADLK